MKLTDLRAMIAQRRQREALYCTADYWDRKARELGGRAVSMWPNNHLNRLYEDEQLALIRRELPALNGARVLDVGCGTGRLSRWLAAQGAEVTGIDFSADALRIAVEQSPAGNPTYRLQSLFDLNEVAAYDIVLSWGVLTMASRTPEDLARGLRRLRDALGEGGRMLLLEPIHRGPLHRVLDMGLSEFTHILESTGIEVLLKRPLHFWPARLALAYLQLPNAITAPAYYLGQLLMRLPGFNRLGDYTAILARRAE